ncbi:Hpt domain-containing protein [Microbulbifer magnicolonia]|uniref:Hpt domain-containing protein n=1 Tax=Microbulbifer magnicolonia TaxID=3109744 RepID=UPI002B40775B|nr:Hpt domain-containing protein [Microbulbifer sp. GG15]
MSDLIIDLEALQAQYGIDKAAIGSLIRVFFKQVPNMIGALESSADAPEAEAFASACHEIATSLAIVGATSLSEQIRQMEHGLRRGASIDRLAAAQSIDADLHRVAQRLAQIKDDLAGKPCTDGAGIEAPKPSLSAF